MTAARMADAGHRCLVVGGQSCGARVLRGMRMAGRLRASARQFFAQVKTPRLTVLRRCADVDFAHEPVGFDALEN